MTLNASGSAGEVQHSKDAESGFTIYTLTQGPLTVQVAPGAGANAFSIKHQGRELLRTPEKLSDLPGFMFGNPVLYPTPNRVRDSKMSFGDTSYEFVPNNNGHFLHGLVHSVPWQVVKAASSNDFAQLVMRLEFAPGSEHFKRFPHEHAVELTVTVRDDSVRFGYTVDNSAGKSEIPFGWAYHPWFLYQGDRKDTYLTVPATHLMETEQPDLLPTGNLLELTGTQFDARQPITVEGFVVDDVYIGLKPEQPAILDFRGADLKITFNASEDFKHMVVYSPANEPWLCVENQTCSTDAHNLHAQGKQDVANLLIVAPGQKAEGFAEFKIAGSAK